MTEQAVFPERSVDSWQPISLPFSGQGAVASSRFPGRFEDYQSHLLGGGWMGLSLAVPRVKKRRKRSLKGHFFFFFLEKTRGRGKQVHFEFCPAQPCLDSVRESCLEDGKKVRMLSPGRAPVPPSSSPPAAGTWPKVGCPSREDPYRDSVTLPAITSKGSPQSQPRSRCWGGVGVGCGRGEGRSDSFPASRARRESRSEVLRRGSGGDAGEAPREGWQRRVLPH